MRWTGYKEQFGASSVKEFLSLNTAFVRSAADNPKYKSVIIAGGNATNIMGITAQDVHIDPGMLAVSWIHPYVNPQYRGKVVKNNFVVPNVCATHTERPGVLFRASVGNAALIGLIKKIRKIETSEFSGPTFLGELRQTISMIRSPLKALRQKTGVLLDLQMRILKDKQSKGGRFKPEPWSRVLASTWLEYVMGAAPLMSDIDAIIDLYFERKNTLGPQKGLKRVSYRFTDKYHDFSQSGSFVYNGAVYPYTEWKLVTASSQYVVWVDMDYIFAGEAAAKRLTAMSKFGLDEIIPTAWELIPWSFLIDYWTNIGDVLGCTFDYQRLVRFGKITEMGTVVRFHNPGKPYINEPGTYALAGSEPWQYTSTYKTLDRRQCDVLGFPQLAVSLPSLRQTFNMAALVTALSKSNPFRGHVLK